MSTIFGLKQNLALIKPESTNLPTGSEESSGVLISTKDHSCEPLILPQKKSQRARNLSLLFSEVDFKRSMAEPSESGEAVLYTGSYQKSLAQDAAKLLIRSDGAD